MAAYWGTVTTYGIKTSNIPVWPLPDELCPSCLSTRFCPWSTLSCSVANSYFFKPTNSDCYLKFAVAILIKLMNRIISCISCGNILALVASQIILNGQTYKCLCDCWTVQINILTGCKQFIVVSLFFFFFCCLLSLTHCWVLFPYYFRQ